MSLTGKQQQQRRKNGNVWGEVLAKKRKHGEQLVYFCVQIWQVTPVVKAIILVFNQRLSLKKDTHVLKCCCFGVWKNINLCSEVKRLWRWCWNALKCWTVFLSIWRHLLVPTSYPSVILPGQTYNIYVVFSKWHKLAITLVDTHASVICSRFFLYTRQNVNVIF